MLNIRKNDSAPAQIPPAITPPPVAQASSAMPAPAQPAAPYQIASRPGERVAPSVIGSDLTIMGNLVSRGEVQIDGEIQGDIHGTNIVVGEKAKITGTIVGDEVVVRGHVMGSVKGKRVMLQASSHVEGDIFHQALSIEQGAFFEGKSRRSEDPTAGVPRPEIPDIASRSAGGPGTQPGG